MKNRTDSQVRRPVVVPRFYFTRFIVPLVLSGLAFSSIATAATVTLTPSSDATIFSIGGVNGIGYLFVGTSGTLLTTERRALLNFDLSGIPSNAVITNATLTLLVLSSQGTDTGSLHRLVKDWAEGDQAGLGFGGGQPSTPAGDNDVSWTVTGLGSTWTSAGADFVPGASASAALPVIVLPAATPIPVSFSDAGMVSDVQGWVDGSFGNSGWILTGSSTISNVRKLASREAVSGQPQLSVTYNVIPIPDADLNDDGFVTVTDFLILRSLLNTTDPLADINGDGVVTVTDFLILRSLLNTAVPLSSQNAASLSSNPIPLPAALPLFSAGLALLGWLRRKTA